MRKFRAHFGRCSRQQSGQTFLLIVVFAAVFLAGVIGLSTDYAQAWAHRQMAQAAADAACQAGAADLYLQVVTSSGSVTGLSWIDGNDHDCSSSSVSSSSVCQYASFNGYSGSNVTISFPTSVSGAPNVGSYCATTSTPACYPYIRVAITDPVPLMFTRILMSTTSINMTASATCGLNIVTAHIPLLVLHRTMSGSFNRNGGASMTIIGGASRSIQVNSSSATAVQPSGGGGSGSIDLSQAGPSLTGADFGVYGKESSLATTSGGYVNFGTKPGKWIENALPWSDPFAATSEPTTSGLSAGAATFVGFGWHGCPDPNGCAEYSHGNYTGCTNTGNFSATYNGYLGGTSGLGCLILPSGFGFSIPQWAASTSYTAGQVVIPSSNNAGKYMFQALTSGSASGSAPTWSQTTFGQTTDNTVTWRNIGITCNNVSNCKVGSVSTGIFDPGVYYLDNKGLQLGSGATVRQSTVSGDGSYGTTFYFSASSSGSNPGTVSVGSAAGNQTGCTPPAYSSCVASYKPLGTDQVFGTSPNTVTVSSSSMNCPAGSGLPLDASGNSIVPSTINGNILMGPCTGTYRGGKASDDASGGTDRGFLFFQGRSTTGIQAQWSGGGDFALTGFMYFHNSGDFSDVLKMAGNPGSTSLALGDIVTDQIQINGTATLKMYLNPNASFPTIAPQLLQ